MAEGRFRFPKTIEEEELCVERAVLKSTRYKNKWAVGILEDWKGVRRVQPLTRPMIEIDVLMLNYWLSKFVQEVAKCSKDPYPPKTLYQIVMQHSPIHVGKEPSHRVQSLGIFRQKNFLRMWIWILCQSVSVTLSNVL